MTVFEAASAVLGRPEVGARVAGWLDRHPIPDPQVPPDAAAWWRRYCHAVVTSQQPIRPGFWEALEDDADWQALVEAGPDAVRPDATHLQALLQRHGIRRHLDKGRWIHRAWNELDVDALARASVSAMVGGGTTRERELEVVASLLWECFRMGVGPKVARLMMIWDAGEGTMGGAFRRVVPLDRRWINALAEEGVDIEARLYSERDYRRVEEEICRAADHAGYLPFLADGAVFGWID